MMIKINSLLLLGSLLVGSTAAAGVKGMHSPPSTRGRQLKKKFGGPNARDCEFSDKKDTVEFECRSKIGGPTKGKDSKDSTDDGATARGISIVPDLEIKDKIKYQVKTTRDGIRVKLEYKNEVNGQDNSPSIPVLDGEEDPVAISRTETETKTKFELNFMSLVEYVKGNDTDVESETEAYNWDSDEILQTIPLTRWDDISDVMNDDVGVVSYFTATSEALGDDGGVVTFNFTIARADQGDHISANSMKIDVRIVDFPWLQTDSSYIALMSTFESQKKVKVKYDEKAKVSEGGRAKRAKDISISFNDEDLEDTLGFTAYGQYTWEEDAKVSRSMTELDTMTSRQGTENMTETMEDTDTIQVVATSPTDVGTETYQSIAYSFVGSEAQGAADIFWDPTTGISYETSSALGGMARLVGAGLVGTITLLAAW
ncbi:expressed unknown protein [Seminavis robusta]|uniref:Uncharacterized protein n=1 Tax=Seminavis robusta TaxID=568900 RepID=A0A9N8HA76_9STRA|nr:expressed unknown protein [Seminavis robusta]|eukprot:Sro232_g093860.1 n/a (428) ;mRNA; f:37106-38487